jgi:hypothetical protein
MAEQLADRQLSLSGVSKAYGAAGRDVLVAAYLPSCEAAVQVQKAAKRLARRQESVLGRQRELAAQREEVLQHHRDLLARAEALFAPPPLPQARPGTTAPFVPDEWEVKRRVDGMVQRQVEKMNGFHPVTGRHHDPDEEGTV